MAGAVEIAGVEIIEPLVELLTPTPTPTPTPIAIIAKPVYKTSQLFLETKPNFVALWLSRACFSTRSPKAIGYASGKACGPVSGTPYQKLADLVQ